jgi:DNA-binding NarL/FixJ family response regulator
MPMNILICDDHTLFREGLVALLERQAGWRVVGQAQDGDEALALAARLAPDVVVMDVAMPGVNGVDATAGILERSPSTVVIALADRRHLGARRALPRELEVFRLLALGHRPKAIAEQLGIGVKTAESHRARIMLKLHTDNLAELIKIAIRAGLVELD